MYIDQIFELKVSFKLCFIQMWARVSAMKATQLISRTYEIYSGKLLNFVAFFSVILRLLTP